jgi:hypothetical protein
MGVGIAVGVGVGMGVAVGTGVGVGGIPEQSPLQGVPKVATGVLAA